MKKSEATALVPLSGGKNAGKSEITNQELLQAINKNIDQKLSVQKNDILTAVDQKLASQKDDILMAMDQKLVVRDNEISELKITVNDVLFAVNKLSDDMEKRLGNIEYRLDNVEQRLSGVEGTINTQMVTKDYLDRKFAEFKLEKTPKHQRVNKLTNILQQKKILTLADTKIILS